MPEADYPRAQEFEPHRIQGISNFCAYHEWVCILGGLAAFGATVAIINSAND